MRLMTMSFKGLCWQVNPTELNVEYAQNIRETTLPFAGSRLTDLGVKKRQVTGKGYFVGSTCMEQWRKLEELFRQGGPGNLQGRAFGTMPEGMAGTWSCCGRRIPISGISPAWSLGRRCLRRDLLGGNAGRRENAAGGPEGGGALL